MGCLIFRSWGSLSRAYHGVGCLSDYVWGEGVQLGYHHRQGKISCVGENQGVERESGDASSL
jgi:hypothetical protein